MHARNILSHMLQYHSFRILKIAPRLDQRDDYFALYCKLEIYLRPSRRLLLVQLTIAAVLSVCFQKKKKEERKKKVCRLLSLGISFLFFP